MRSTVGLVMAVCVLLAGPVAGTAPDRTGATKPPGGPGVADPPGRHTPPDSFGWPLPGEPEVVGAFDPPAHPYGRGHRGVDLAAAPGDPVLAASAGTVVFAGPLAGRGVVSIDHPGGLRTTYEPVQAAVQAGERVGLGERIGALQPGHAGCAAAACLHWGLRRDGVYLNPLWALGAGPLRLLPWDPAGRVRAGDG